MDLLSFIRLSIKIHRKDKANYIDCSEGLLGSLEKGEAAQDPERRKQGHPKNAKVKIFY